MFTLPPKNACSCFKMLTFSSFPSHGLEQYEAIHILLIAGVVYKGHPPIFGVFLLSLPPCPLYIHYDLNPLKRTSYLTYPPPPLPITLFRWRKFFHVVFNIISTTDPLSLLTWTLFIHFINIAPVWFLLLDLVIITIWKVLKSEHPFFLSPPSPPPLPLRMDVLCTQSLVALLILGNASPPRLLP